MNMSKNIEEMLEKRVLLLGGNGFLGRNLVSCFAQEVGFDVSVYDITPIEEKIDNVSYFIGSIENTEKVFEIMNIKKINVLILMISNIIPGSTVEQYISNCKQVQLSTIPIMDYCGKNNVEIVFFSSGGTVYGVKGGIVSENEPTSPISYYGLSKVQTEDLINFYHRRYGLNYLILRPSNPYGLGQNIFGKQGLIAVILGCLLKKEPITVFGNGDVVRDYIYIDDFVFYVKELIKKRIINETINIGSGEGYSINQIIDIVKSIVEYKVEVKYISSRKDDVPKLILDTTRLHNLVLHENISLEDGIRLFYDEVNS